jgi:lipopolysaccharide transport system permease protein
MMLLRLWRHRSLLLTLTRRQYELRYRQSLVGILWAVFAPLGALAVATLLFGKVLKVDTSGAPYPLFALAALVPWGFFASSLTFGVQSISQGGGLVTRFAFPRAVLPLSMIGTAFIDLLVSGALFVIFLYVSGYAIPLTALWVFPLLALEIVLVVAVVFLTSALNVFARDIKLFVPIGVQLLLFVTPVMYSLRSVPQDIRPWFRLNPMAGLVESFRRVLVYGSAPDLTQLLPTIVGALVVFALGTWYFSATEPRFADVI